MYKDNIRTICEDRGISISQIEKELGYGNGSIMKSKSMSANRLAEIAHYLGLSVDELYIGHPVPSEEISSDEGCLLKKQNCILKQMSFLNDIINLCQEQLIVLQKEYDNL